MLKPVLFFSLLGLGVAATASAAALHSRSIHATPQTTERQLPILDAAYDLTGQEKLKLLLRPHSQYLPITQAVRDATGDPNIVVFDNRSPRNDVNRCSFIIYHGKRAMVCD
ncbi:MAG: hypothetical protein V3V02_05655 [Rhizobiaceae bacterium]